MQNYNLIFKAIEKLKNIFAHIIMLKLTLKIKVTDKNKKEITFLLGFFFFFFFFFSFEHGFIYIPRFQLRTRKKNFHARINILLWRDK